MLIYKVVGLMSGTSLDGVDLAFCEFKLNDTWSFDLIQSVTIPYDTYWKKLLGELHQATAEEVSETDFKYGNYLGKLTKEFCLTHAFTPDFIASHGHTVFHNPAKGFTKQIGSGAALSAVSGFPVVCDFRSKDVALGGQGAPLVPVGDKLLFSGFDYCLNLGGIANISFEDKKERKAFDVCACNLVLNHYAMKKGMSFDTDGLLAERGVVQEGLLQKLNDLHYYSRPFPKSLGREDVERDLIPFIDSGNFSVEDILSTFCEHIALQVAGCVPVSNVPGKLLLTGGGAFNTFLVKRIAAHSKSEIIVPEKKIVEFKEAIIFAFLGVLRMRNEINCLKSVTGASTDNCGGSVYT